MYDSQRESCSISQYRYDATIMVKITCLLLCLFCMPGFATAKSSTALAEEMISKGRDAMAINILRKEVKKNPQDFKAWFMLGVTEAKRRQFHDAIQAFNKVIELQPKLAEPHNNLAVIYNELGDLRAAVRELEASLELNPAYGTAHENIGDLYVKLAAQSYKQALVKGDNAMLQQRYERLLRIHGEENPGASAKPAGKKVAAPVVATTKPVVKAVKAASDSMPDAVSEEVRQELLQAIEAWRSAWSKQDLEAYYAAYDENFGPNNRFKTRKSWKRYKNGAIKNKKFINVELEDIVISSQPEGLVKAAMLQHYSSDRFKSDDLKELIFRKSDSGWKITYEISR